MAPDTPNADWISLDRPALVLAPMEGITDAPMRAYQGATGAFSYAVSEFLRVSGDPLPAKAFLRDIPELLNGNRTITGLPVQIQILGGDAGRMALSALNAFSAGARAIDINFGCPAPTVNKHDGGASLLRHPLRIREIVAAVREVLPPEIPVSAKLRLGWDDIEAIHENAEMAAQGGASWLTIHARTRMQGYQPPVFWRPIGMVRERLELPVIANGDIWTFDDFKRCRDETGSRHYMLGRSALADPFLSRRIAKELGLAAEWSEEEIDWIRELRRLVCFTEEICGASTPHTVMRLKQWLKIAKNFGGFAHFDSIKETKLVDEFFGQLSIAVRAEQAPMALVR